MREANKKKRKGILAALKAAILDQCLLKVPSARQGMLQ